MSFNSSIDPSIIDVQGLMSHIDSDLETLKDLVEIFEDYYPEQLEALEIAGQKASCTEIREIAHQLKGALSNFYGVSAVKLAKELENAGREGKIEQSREIIPQLKHEIQTLAKNLVSLDVE